MKNFKIFLLFLFLYGNISFSQNSKDEDQNIKKGWSFGVLPAITYNSDLGFQYGGLIDLYNYGNGDIYPKYYDRYFLEISFFTKGSRLYHFSYESNRILSGRTVYVDVKYQPDEQYDFYGVNGYESVYNSNWEDQDENSYKSRMFYKNQTKRLKAKLDILNPINEHLSWMGGLEFFNYEVNTLDVNRYNDGRDEEDQIYPTDQMPGLWDRYVKWGIFDPDNAHGGSFLGLKGGMMYDTRDNWSNASKGIWTEAVLVWVPGFIGNISSSHLKLNITLRQYLTLIKDKLTFVYRLAYSGNIAGDEPYYSMPVMYNVMLKGSAGEGLGGKRTLRGIRRNRVVGNGEFLGNTEFRYKFVEFRWLKQNWYLSLNAFLDAGRVVQLTDIKGRVNRINDEKPLTDYDIWGQYAIGFDANGNPNGDTLEDYFNFGGEKMHYSYGGGFKIALNENFVIGLDYGRSINTQDGDSGLYFGLNYNF
jgi:hypothetical protein